MKRKDFFKRLKVCWSVLTTHSYYTFFCTKDRQRITSYVNELPFKAYKYIRDNAIKDTFLYDGVFNFDYESLKHRISEDTLRKFYFELKVDYGWNSQFERWFKTVGENKLEIYYTFKKDSKPWHIALRNKDGMALYDGYVGTVEDLRNFFKFAGIDYDILDVCADFKED